MIGRFCVITDTSLQGKYSHYMLAKMAIKGGADMIQFRDKKMPTDEMVHICSEIADLCRRNNITFIVNDRVDITFLAGANGVHLGKEDIPIREARKLLGNNKIIGATAHSLEEAFSAEQDGADYIGFGHIFNTSSKYKKDAPKGIRKLKNIVRRIKIPVIAIGGINSGNIKSVLETNVYGVAVLGAVCCSSDPFKATENLRKKIFS